MWGCRLSLSIVATSHSTGAGHDSGRGTSRGIRPIQLGPKWASAVGDTPPAFAIAACPCCFDQPVTGQPPLRASGGGNFHPCNTATCSRCGFATPFKVARGRAAPPPRGERLRLLGAVVPCAWRPPRGTSSCWKSDSCSRRPRCSLAATGRRRRTSSPEPPAGGWTGGWVKSTSSSTFGSATVASSSPLGGGGNYLAATATTSAAEGTAAVGRGYSTANGVDTGLPQQVSFDFRLDSSLTGVTNIRDRERIWGDSAARGVITGAATWVAGVFGAATGTLPAGNWGFQNGQRDGNASQPFVDTGVHLAAGTVYHFVVTLDPAAGTYKASVNDGGTGTGHTYTSGTLGFATNATFGSATSTYVNAGVQRSASGAASLVLARLGRRQPHRAGGPVRPGRHRRVGVGHRPDLGGQLQQRDGLQGPAVDRRRDLRPCHDDGGQRDRVRRRRAGRRVHVLLQGDRDRGRR